MVGAHYKDHSIVGSIVLSPFFSELPLYVSGKSQFWLEG